MAERFFIRQLQSRTVYRDDNGKFVKREQAIRRGLRPSTETYYVYKRADGKRVSASVAEKSKKKIVTVTRTGDLLQRQSKEVKKKVREIMPEPSFQETAGQQFNSMVNDAIDRNAKVGVQFGGNLYELTPQQMPDLQAFYHEMEAEYIRLFKDITGGVYLTFLHAISPDLSSEVYDFDVMHQTGDIVQGQNLENRGLDSNLNESNDPRIQAANEAFRNKQIGLWNKYFGDKN